MSDRGAVEMLKAARLFEGLSKKDVGEVARRSKEIEHAAGDERWAKLAALKDFAEDAE